MLDRRRLLLTGLAAMAATRAAAQDVLPDPGTEVAMPQDLSPRLVEIGLDVPPGEIHVDPDSFGVYWTMTGGLAMRYSCGIGRPGLYEPGIFFVGERKEWPSWTPTPDMIAREPDRYAQYADGMPGGPDNPLGARALYLFTPERGDTFLRIHGTGDPSTIGMAVSNGCARLVNDDIVALYDMVPLNAPVYLYPPLLT